MKRFALFGAGFSRNWGGWLGNEVFEYLLGDRDVVGDADLQRKLWSHKDRGGFEITLSELQTDAKKTGKKDQLIRLESATTRLFEDMDVGFSADPNFRFEFTQGALFVGTFLRKFDAIFTLNQDVLLERHYLNQSAQWFDSGKWDGWDIPGMRPTSELYRQGVHIYTPKGEISLKPRRQPYFKLHGSANWKSPEGRPIIAVGGNKTGTIQSHEILSKYYSHFVSALSEAGSRLMIIGFGFRDEHIKEAIRSAARQGLRIFIVDPLGVDVAQENLGAQIKTRNEFQDWIIGASRRSVSEIFGRDRVERAKLDRFFA